ncbi:MAG: hypothetical protein AAGE52_29215 [Myxococcota bacterium]
MDGPLDELFPGWRAPSGDVPDEPVHPRVLALPAEDSVDFVFVVWRDPGEAEALHTALRGRIEAALLSELSRPASHLLEVPLQALNLISFATIPEEALAAFALTKTEPDASLVALARGEASALSREVPDDPSGVYRTAVVATPLARALEKRLATAMKDEVFGARPGGFFARLNVALELEGRSPLPPKATSLDVLEKLLVPAEEGVVRWIPPLCFQALADAIGVVAARQFGRNVHWAETRPDEHGVAPPPMIRVRGDEGWIHLPLGLELLRWCVMPRQPKEEIPPLREWLSDRIGSAGR